MSENFTRGLFRTLSILEPYLPQIVIGGGWAPFLYYRYLVGNRLHTPVLTGDIDLMVRNQVPVVGSKTIDEILTVEAKLKTTFKNLDNPPVIHYEGVIDGVEVEIEFLTDQTGSQQEKVIQVQKGLHAEALRYVSIIVENTLMLEIDRELAVDRSSTEAVSIHISKRPFFPSSPGQAKGIQRPLLHF